MRPLRLFLTWPRIRGLSQLEILNRVSILLLVLVPILAAAWPAVLAVVNRYNQSVYRARDVLDSSATKLQEGATEFEKMTARVADESTQKIIRNELESLKSNATTLTTKVNEYLKEFEPKALTTVRLPWLWALAFFASLFVIIGRCLFQLACPELVQEGSLSQYVDRKREEFAKTPSDTMLRSAINDLTPAAAFEEHLRDLIQEEQLHQARTRQEESRLDAEIMRLRSDVGYARARAQATTSDVALKHELENALGELEKAQAERDKLSITDHDALGPVFRRRMSIIEHGAEQRYLIESARNSKRAALCVILYLIAIFFVLVIVVVQSFDVANAAGWFSHFQNAPNPS